MGKIKAFIFRKDKTRCRFCGRKLTEEEKYFYEFSCNKCERKHMKGM